MTALTLVGPDPAAESDAAVLAAYERHMLTAKFSPITITDRLELLGRLSAHLPTGFIAAEPVDLERWQQTFAHLSRATVNIYTRHALALYRWLVDTDRLATDPTRRLIRVASPRGIPHPISESDLRMLLACATGPLRLAYVLAAFAGLRAGEITRLRAEDLKLDAPQPTGYIQGKGGRERVVPLLPPVVTELKRLRLPARGMLLRKPDGRAWTPDQLSNTSHVFMRSVGIESTLHSLRHYFATEVVRLTKDILLTRDLLGHASVATTQIYMASSIDGAQDRLAGLSSSATSLIGNTE